MIATVDFASLQDPQVYYRLKSRTTRPDRRAFESCRIPADQRSCWPVPLALAFTMRVRVRVRVPGGDRVGLRTRIEVLPRFGARESRRLTGRPCGRRRPTGPLRRAGAFHLDNAARPAYRRRLSGPGGRRVAGY